MPARTPGQTPDQALPQVREPLQVREQVQVLEQVQVQHTAEEHTGAAAVRTEAEEPEQYIQELQAEPHKDS